MINIPFNFKTEDLIKSGRTTKYNVEGLKEWLKQMPALPEMQDEQLGIYLIACNNDIEATKNCIIAYFKHRALGPELFSDRSITREDLKLVHKVSQMAIIPKRTKDNYMIVLGQLKDTSYSNFYVDAQAKYLYMLLDCLLYNDPPNGLIVIINIKGVGLMHLTRLKVSIVKKFFQYLQEALPTKLKEIHVLNTSYVFDKAMLIMKPFMSKELFDIIIKHPPNMDLDHFFENYISADLFPADLGGKMSSMEELNEKSLELCQNLQQYLATLEQQVDMYKENRI
ncbi:hypothetical protein GWI33_006000 [Rhynchophorus ferrugineus]|uniref:CRAL-TRIO domain-containing protein n=1 Tax=Rhynchophorus ferrugineus TaxID=354439 RepID=A0A834MNJ9_RHYFE|nr:hypothetical protein GWI33_006000 [Rhynchophorus ferrugineus]